MSIAESMITTNNDISEPINYLMWIDDLATFGTRGYVAKDGVKIKELYTKSINLFRNDMAVDEMNKSRQVDKMLNDAEVSAVIQKLAESKTTYVQMTEVIGDTTAMNAVIASTTAMNAVAASTTAMNAVAASTTAMNAVIASTTAMNAVIASTTAMNAVAASTTAMNAVIASTTAMNAVIASTTAMNAVAASTTAMNAVAASTTAINAIESSSTAKNILANSPRKQIISSIPATGSWTNRRSGKIWLISMKQSWSNPTDQTFGVLPTINGGSSITTTCQQTYNIDYRVDKFLSRLDNYCSAGRIGNVCTYVFIPIS